MIRREVLLAADDSSFAALVRSYLKKALEAPVPCCRFDSVGEQLVGTGERVLLLGIAGPGDIEPVERLLQQSHWQQWGVQIVVIVSAAATVERDLGGLDPYSCRRIDWPEQALVLGDLLRQPHNSPASLPLAARCERIRHGLLEQTPSLAGMAESLALAASHDVHVLLTGATGTGKTFLARQIHDHSARGSERLLVVPCASLVANLMENELFGHARGAFTGADRSKIGKLEAAGAGTLLLDEIDTLSPEQQAKLLRVVETGEYEPVGSNRTRACRARLIFASNWDLEEAVAAGRFRRDLYYRINVMSFHLPLLRERVQDIKPLATVLVARFARQFHKPQLTITVEAQALLEAHPWPGNIRQLENVLQNAVLACPDTEIAVEHLPLSVRQPAGPSPGPAPTGKLLMRNCQGFERAVIQKALFDSNHSRVRAARALGISRVTLYKKMKKYGLMERLRQPA